MDKVDEANENLAIAAYHQARKQERARREAEMNQRNSDYIHNSERLREHHDNPKDAFGRFQRTEYKRLSQDERQTIFNTNGAQILQKKAQGHMDKMEAEEEARQ